MSSTVVSLTPLSAIHSNNPQDPPPSIHDASSAIPPSTATSITQRWNNPPINIPRTIFCFFAFLLYGINDGTPGAMVPHLEAYYSLPYSVVSLIFLGPMLGCITAAFTSRVLHHRWGRRGVAGLATGSYVVSYAGLSLHPPFGVVVALLVMTGFGSGLMNGSWNSWVGGLANGGTLLAFMHGCWGAGATVAPLVVTAFVSNGWNWWTYYCKLAGTVDVLLLTLQISWYDTTWTRVFFLIDKTGLAVIAAISTTSSFWADSGETRSSNPRGFTLAVLKDKTTLLLSTFMLLYVGAEVTIGGWLFTFMMNVRNGTSSASSLVASGFWIGITVGRFALGWITSHVGEKIMVSAYLVVAIALELAFWLGKEFVVSAIMAALVGLSIGMVMPASIRMMTKMLPPEKHIVSVGFGTAFAVSGSSMQVPSF
ncbi:hypothetical protein ACJ41O_007520 [Fusarium nematophilum]